MTENVTTLDIDLSSINQEAQETSNTIKGLREQIKEYRTTLEQATIGSEEFDKALEDLTSAQDQLKNATKRTSDAVAGSYDAMVKEMGELKKQWRATSDEMERKDLGNKIGQLNTQLKDLDASIGNYQRNVGNYTGALTDMKESINNMGDTLQGISNGFSTATMLMSSMGIEGEGLSKVMKNMQIAMSFTNALKSLSKGAGLFKEMGVAIKGAAVSTNLYSTAAKTATVDTTTLTVATEGETVATGAATVATHAFRQALISTGIGAIVVGLGLLIANFDKLTKVLGITTTQTKDYSGSLDKLDKQFKIIDEDNNNEIRIMKAKGATLDEIHKKQVQDIQDKINNIKAIQAEMVAEANKLKSDRARAKFVKKNKEEYDNMTKAIEEYEAAIVSLNKTFQTDKEVKYWEDKKKGASGAAKATDDAAKAWENYVKVRDRNQESRNQLGEDLAKEELKGLNLAVAQLTLVRQKRDDAFQEMYDSEVKQLKEMLEKKQITQKQYDSGLELLDDRHKEVMKNSEKQFQKDLEKINKEEEEKKRKKTQEETKQKISDLKDRYEKEMDLLEIHRKSQEIEMERQGDTVGINAINQEFLKQQEEKLKAVREEYIAFGQDTTEIDNAISENLLEQQQLFYESFDEKKDKLLEMMDVVKASADKIVSIGNGISSEWAGMFDAFSSGIEAVSDSLKKGEKGWRSYAAIATASIGVASQMLTALADEQDEKSEQGFETQKKLQIANVVMNTLSGIISAVTSAFSPANAWMTIYGQSAVAGATSAMIAGLGIAQISKISKTKFGDTSVDSSVATTVPNASAVSSIQSGSDNVYLTGANIESQVKDTKVYVTETDISNVQNRVSVTESEASF